MQESTDFIEPLSYGATIPFAIKASRMLTDAHNLRCFGIITFLGTEPVRKKNPDHKTGMFPNGDKAACSSGAIDGKTRIYLVYTCIYSTIFGVSAKQ
jgi:hypothetical protein